LSLPLPHSIKVKGGEKKNKKIGYPMIPPFMETLREREREREGASLYPSVL